MTNKKAKNEMHEREKNERYLKMIYSILKKRDTLVVADEIGRFNDTEVRLLVEILAAKYDGKRLISTQLAKALGVTRSAVSQIVNRLEEEGVVKRVADDVDRKIAYIEIAEEIMALYEEDLKGYLEHVGVIIKKFGEEKFETLYSLVDEFLNLIEEEKWKTK